MAANNTNVFSLRSVLEKDKLNGTNINVRHYPILLPRVRNEFLTHVKSNLRLSIGLNL